MKLFTALENETTFEPNTEHQQQIQELEGQLCDHEVTEAYTEVASNQDISDNAEADVGTLTKVNDILVEATESNKVLTKDVLQMSKVITESICARLGYKPTSSLFIATEDLDSSTKYQEAIAMESFGEVVKRTWEAIIKFFKRIAEGIKNLWNKLFSRTKITKTKNEQNQNIIKEQTQKETKKIIEIKKDDIEETKQLETRTKIIKSDKVKHNKEINIDFIKDFIRSAISDDSYPSSNASINRKLIYSAISFAVSEAKFIMLNLNKDVNDLFRLLDKINSVNDVETMDAILEKAEKQYILSKKDSFKKICLIVSPVDSSSSWVITSPYDLYKSQFIYHSFSDVENIIGLDNICYKNDELIKELEKTLDDVRKMKQRLTELNDEYEREFNKELKIGDYNKDVTNRFPFIRRFLRIISVYLLTIPRVCGDISHKAEEYITKNLQVITSSDSKVTT